MACSMVGQEGSPTERHGVPAAHSPLLPYTHGLPTSLTHTPLTRAKQKTEGPTTYGFLCEVFDVHVLVLT